MTGVRLGEEETKIRGRRKQRLEEEEETKIRGRRRGAGEKKTSKKRMQA
jgi:hypothetical protein